MIDRQACRNSDFQKSHFGQSAIGHYIIRQGDVDRKDRATSFDRLNLLAEGMAGRWKLYRNVSGSFDSRASRISVNEGKGFEHGCAVQVRWRST